VLRLTTIEYLEAQDAVKFGSQSQKVEVHAHRKIARLLRGLVGNPARQPHGEESAQAPDSYTDTHLDNPHPPHITPPHSSMSGTTGRRYSAFSGSASAAGLAAVQAGSVVGAAPSPVQSSSSGWGAGSVGVHGAAVTPLPSMLTGSAAVGAKLARPHSFMSRAETLASDDAQSTYGLGVHHP
ncbi:hypothetical protein HK405_000228, partial [Cladochytrium tenue]